MRCLNCGQEVQPTDRFCANCGIDIRRPATQPTTVRRLCHSCGQEYVHQEGRPSDLCSACQERIEAKRQSQAERREREQKKFQESARAGLASQRKARRFEVAGCFVRVRKIGMTAMFMRKDQSSAGPVVDLSTTGLQCVAAGDFGKGDPVGLQLLVPAFNNPLSLRGIVRWAKGEDQERTRIGIEFAGVDEAAAAHLAALEKHESLRDAANRLEEKRATRTLPAMQPEKRSERPQDF